MNDIERAIELIKNMLPEKVSYANLVGASNCYGDKYVYEEPEPYALELAISSLEKQLNNGWIPVSTGRLPEEPTQRVNVTLKNEMVLEVWYINNAFKFHEPLGCGGLEKVNDYNPVIAWQPLPEPYKEGE